MSACAHGPVARELLQELGREHRAGLAQVGRVLQVGEDGVDVAAVARVHREGPDVVAARLAGGQDLVAPGLVVGEDAGVEVAERDLHRAGQRGQVEHVRGALLPRVPERVGEHEAALGVGVGDLDRLAVGGGDDVAGPVGVAARHVLGGRGDGQHAHRQAELGDRAGGLDHGRAAGHVALHVLHVQRGLERDAAGVEGDRLADEAEHDVAAGGLRRVVAQHDQARGVVAALRDRGQGAHPELRDLVGVERLGADVLERRRDLLRALGEPLRRGLVRRAVDEVARAVRPLGDRRRALRPPPPGRRPRRRGSSESSFGFGSSCFQRAVS